MGKKIMPIVISDCVDCKKFYDEWNVFCKKEKRHIEFEANPQDERYRVSQIPDWCPLEDAEE